jgi:hypothetical protein
MPLSSVVGAQSIIKPGVCTSSTRPAVPFEGQVIFETDTDRLYVYNGTAWVIPNSPAQNPQGLELITTVTCTSGGTASGGVVTVGSAVSSVVVATAFSSTYDNYKIVYEGGVSSALNDFTIILGATVSGYYSNMMYSYFNATTPTVINTSNASSFVYVGGATTTNTHLEFDLFNPFVTKNTILTNATWLQATPAGGVGKTNGYLSNTTSYSGFTIGLATGTITGGTVRVYGYRNS